MNWPGAVALVLAFGLVAVLVILAVNPPEGTDLAGVGGGVIVGALATYLGSSYYRDR